MPESLRAFCNMVSLTAANTSRIFEVSVACVRLLSVKGVVLRDIQRRLTVDIDSDELY